MRVITCDICNKKLTDKPIRAGVGFFGEKDFCSDCGKPIINFLKKHGFVNKEAKKFLEEKVGV